MSGNRVFVFLLLITYTPNTYIMIIHELSDVVIRILRTAVRRQCAEMRHRAIMQIGRILGAAASFAVSMTLALIIAVFVTIGVVRWLETIMAPHWAYLSVAGVYVLLYVLARVLRRRLFYQPISRQLFRIFDPEGE